MFIRLTAVEAVTITTYRLKSFVQILLKACSTITGKILPRMSSEKFFFHTEVNLGGCWRCCFFLFAGVARVALRFGAGALPFGAGTAFGETDFSGMRRGGGGSDGLRDAGPISYVSACNCMYGVTKARTVSVLDVTTVVLIVAQSDGFAAQSDGIAVFIVRVRCPVTNDVNKAGWISTWCRES